MTLSGTLVFFTNWVKACHIGSLDWWVCCFEIDVSGCTWEMTPVLGDPNVTAFLKALSLHRCHPTYLGVTLDRTLSYRVHMTKTAGKLKNRNNLLMKLAGSTWARAPTLCGHLLWRFAIQQQSNTHTSQVNGWDKAMRFQLLLPEQRCWLLRQTSNHHAAFVSTWQSVSLVLHVLTFNADVVKQWLYSCRMVT